MPYIKREAREQYKEWLEEFDEIMKHQSPGVGDMNYIITMLIKKWLGDNPNYEKFNNTVGFLEACKLELYARAVRPYEDRKIVENGDVY